MNGAVCPLGNECEVKLLFSLLLFYRGVNDAQLNSL